ncbi:hypothetical protein [Xylocopilactobacillus apicola]|uniref:Surface protein n=1 Tax=Xylocopilactobacillus apicola TaxID=2932184 RepID=A0AAU9DU57_9LACO|nr:hypothetical protein [Xylocopilactobacillus apicola]BDR59003.1 hypothetical protein XA3_14440 [Xylocopilactobacillus apicola]
MKRLKRIGYLLVGLLSVWTFGFALNNKTSSRGAEFPDNVVGVNDFRGGHLADSFGNSLLRPRESSTVVNNGVFRLSAESNFSGNNGYVSLSWDAVSDVDDGYIVERTTDGYTWVVPPTNYGKHIKILNVYPPNGNFLKTWFNQIDPNTGQPVSMGLIDVTPVSLAEFNKNPDGYMKDGTGKYAFDGIYFGSADSNGGGQPVITDLTADSQLKVEAFGRSGRSLIFGHDTLVCEPNPAHPYFNKFANKIGLQLRNEVLANGGSTTDIAIADHAMGTNRVSFSTVGLLNQYPYELDPTKIYKISPAHSVMQYFDYTSGATRWMQFSPGTVTFPNSGTTHYAYDQNGNIIGDDNWYLVSKNNYAMIQTGHTTGACTPDEAKIIANMTYHTSTLNTTTKGVDRTVKDDAAPDIPEIGFVSQDSDRLNLNINTSDNGVEYLYRVKAKTLLTTKISDLVKVLLKSGLKGYVYQIDDDPLGMPSINKNSVTGEVTNINLNPNSSSDDQASLNIDRADGAGKYLHIVAVDNANNVSDVKTISLSDYLWWSIDPTTKALTIFPHELNGAVDNTNLMWPWHNRASEITKVVMKPGVTATGSLKNLFADLSSATSIDGLTAIDTSNVTDYSSIFQNCNNLKTLDLTNFKVKNGASTDQMLSGTNRLWKLTLGAETKLSATTGLPNPNIQDQISDGGETYYCTDPQWREVGTGSDHDAKGAVRIAAQIISDSQTSTTVRTYVWDQTGRCTMTVPSSIEFGRHELKSSEFIATSANQNVEVTDTRNIRKHKKWHLEAEATRFKNNSGLVIASDPLIYTDTAGDHPLSATPTVLGEQQVPGLLFQDNWSLPWNLKIKLNPRLVPASGKYQSKITFTLTDVAGL